MKKYLLVEVDRYEVVNSKTTKIESSNSNLKEVFQLALKQAFNDDEEFDEYLQSIVDDVVEKDGKIGYDDEEISYLFFEII